MPRECLKNHREKSKVRHTRAKAVLPNKNQLCSQLSFHAPVNAVELTPKKDKLTEAPILIAPNWDLPFELMCDASDFAIGAVLGQRHEKHFRPIHYASKTLDSKHTRTTLRPLKKKLLAYSVIPRRDCSDGSPFLHEFDFKVIDTKEPGSGYHQKDRKPSQNDKTEHGMEKTVQNQGQSPKMPKSEHYSTNQPVKPEPELKKPVGWQSYPSDGRGRESPIVYL
ncbi:reverse transcriptase domain-containing protein [Tanacetum coccineum]|uniref:Reverse transcriptase domain-containing protein n=1 Tax=Tanacetum coccineum TaxID=301880 RepID=A0ABQ5IMF3_9ASTR